MKGTSFTLVPLADSLDFGKNPKVLSFHFSAIRDTLSTVYDNQQRIIQNVYVSALKEPLDSTILYSGAFMDPEVREKFLNTEDRITEGVPVYDGGDSLSFDFSKEYAEQVLAGVQRFQQIEGPEGDSLSYYLKEVPGIYITSEVPAGNGGRINMFEIDLEYDTNYGYITGNYAELKIRSDYGERSDVDTSFVFYFGPGDLLKNLEDNENIAQFAFNSSDHDTKTVYEKDGVVAGKEIYVEGGSGVKPVIKASEIRDIIERQMGEAGIADIKETVINKATIILPYNVSGDYEALDKFPMIMSPTVKLRSTTGNYGP